MKIGLLAYHSVCNFGAMLQLLSTYMFLKNHGHEPMVINWVAKDLEEYYTQNTPISQIENQKKLRLKLWNETCLCLQSDCFSSAGKGRIRTKELREFEQLHLLQDHRRGNPVEKSV